MKKLILYSSICSLALCAMLYAPCAYAQVVEKWKVIYDGGAGDRGADMVVDDSANVYVTGYSQDGGGLSDYYTVKYDSNGVELWSATYVLVVGNDYAQAIAIDAAGNVYVTGYSNNGGGSDEYLTIKYNASGGQLWAVTFNNFANQRAQDIVVDAAGSIYVTGDGGPIGSTDYITVKYNPDGTQAWWHQYNGPGNGNDYARAIVVDDITGTGVYVTGSGLAGVGDDFITINILPSGTFGWGQFYNGIGNGNDVARAIAIDATGVYVTGESEFAPGNYDYVTIKYDFTGVQLWTTPYDGGLGGNDRGRAIALDGSGNVYVTGFSSNGANDDIVTVKYNNTGTELWPAVYDGGSDDIGEAIAVDASGNVYVTGKSGIPGIFDYTTIKYNTSGVQQWDTVYGNPIFDDLATAIAVDNSGNVYVTGYSRNSVPNDDIATIKYCDNIPVASVVADLDTICTGFVATLTASGGTNYQWSTGDAAAIITVVPPLTTTYWVIVSNSCSSDTAYVTITVNPLPLAIITASSPTTFCAGDSVDLLSVDTAGIANYDWLLNGVATGATGWTYNALMGGDYQVVVWNTFGCYDTSAAITVTVNPLPTANITASGPTTFCQGNSVTLTSDPAAGYSWNTGAATQSITVSVGGVYSVTVTDGNGCSGTSAATSVVVNPLPTVNLGSDTTLCTGGTFILDAGNVGSTYLWSTIEITQTIVVSTSGTYWVEVIDANSCLNIDSIILTINPLPIVDAGVDISICNDGSTVILGGSPTASGTSPLTYNWSPGINLDNLIAANPVFTPLSVGITQFEVIVTDGNGCIDTATILITINNLPIVNLGSDTTICTGGTLILNASNTGSAYVWQDASTNQTYNVISSGTYSVQVTDPGGCTASDTITISLSPAMTTGITAIPENNCQGDGIAILTVTGGTLPYTFLWSNGAITQNLSGLSAGTYIVTVTDSNDCTAIDTAAIGGALPPTTSISSIAETGCGNNDGTAVLSVFGGVAPYTFSWSNGATTQNIAGLASGTYTVIVTDANTCLAFDTAVIGSPPLPSVSITGFDEGACDANNGIAVMTASGGTSPYTYSWSNGATTLSITGLTPGIYVGTVTDNLGCSASDAVTINEAPGPSVTLTGIDEGSCGAGNGTVISSASGGTSPYTYLWSTGATTVNITLLSSGTYSLTVTDSINCTVSDSVTLQEPATFTLSISATTNATCGTNDGSATVTITGGTPPFTYSWSSGDTLATADSLIAGIYIITVTDATGCSNFAVATISNVGGATITTTLVTNVSCFGGSDGAINITVTGGIAPYTYSWSDGNTSQDISSLAAGPYEVNVTDNSGCVSTKSILVTQPAALSLTVSETAAICDSADGSATVSVAGGTGLYTFSWATTGGTDSTETGLTAGIYTVTVSDANGCTDSITAAISNFGGPAIVVDLIENADCGAEIGAIYITVSGGTEPYAYLWSSGDTTQDITGLPAGIYDVTVTDSTNCLSTESFEITGAQPPLETICLVTVDSATGKNLIVWEKNQTTLVKSYNIYKESSQINVYYLIGNMPVDSVSVFVDTLSDPKLRSWRYKMQVVDSCDNESDLSADHKTMHLNINLGIPPAINLIWDHYEGFPFATYYVTRYTVSTGWVTLDSLASNLTSYTDPTPPNEDLYYVVEVKHPTGCDPNLSKVLTYNSARSNVSNRLLPTGITEGGTSLRPVQVFPNPYSGVTQISYTLPEKADVLLEVFNVLGKKIQVLANGEQKSGAYQYSFSAKELGYSSGVYILKLIAGEDVYTKQLIEF